MTHDYASLHVTGASETRYRVIPGVRIHIPKEVYVYKDNKKILWVPLFEKPRGPCTQYFGTWVLGYNLNIGTQQIYQYWVLGPSGKRTYRDSEGIGSASEPVQV